MTEPSATDTLLKTSRQWLATLRFYERGPMKLTHIAALLVLFVVGCTAQTDTAPATDSGAASTEPAATATVEPETETQLASTTVKFDVTGMH